MELSELKKQKKSTLKKVLIFLQKNFFFFYFRKWNFLALTLKNFLHFFQKKAFLKFREMELLKGSSYISEENFLISEKTSYISRNGAL